MNPDDITLTERGLPPPARGTVLLIACGALAHEILSLKRLNGWDHLSLSCLPAKYHLTPDVLPDAVEAAVVGAAGQFDKIFVVYADCGTGGLLKARCDSLGVEMVAGPHCYSFFEGNAAFDARSDEEMTTFYLTDFLVRQFDAFVWRPLGLDRYPQLRDTYFGNYEKLVYQAQTEDPDLTKKARQCAERLGLAFEHRYTSYGDLEPALAAL
ncbi:MAG: DUF1638 domain-containing protein [Pseudomonadota bacterium]